MLTFEEDDPPESLELAVKQVVSIVKSAQEKVNLGLVWFWCTLGQEMLTFLISVKWEFYLSILLYLKPYFWPF